MTFVYACEQCGDPVPLTREQYEALPHVKMLATKRGRKVLCVWCRKRVAA